MGFDEKQMAEYKEVTALKPSSIYFMWLILKYWFVNKKKAFGVIDKDGDGTIDHKELKACFEELGQSAKDSDLKAMVAEAKGPLNFPAFVKLFEDKLNGTDAEDKLLEAFKVFDMSGSGKLTKDA